jgi:hypothetical protein
MRIGLVLLANAFAVLGSNAGAKENIEWVAEHLPEIAMDNRYASLPLWSICERDPDAVDVADQPADPTCSGIGLGYGRTHSESLSMDGPMLSLGFAHPLGEKLRLTGFVFFDDLAFHGGTDRRPLDITFATPPIGLPVDAEFTGLKGDARDLGAGMALGGSAHWRWLPPFEWSAGLLWQRLELRDYQFDYLVTAGPAAGTGGRLDYSSTYNHVAPFLGAAWQLQREAWSFTPHVQVAMPLPRRGIAGRITGPGFDLSSNASDNGGGKHFGDPSVTIGFDVTYVPWGLTLDLGSAITQTFLERKIHEGVRHDLMITAYWAF